MIMALYGIAASSVFDLFRSIYRVFKPSAVTVGIGDILFWLILSVTTFFAVFLTSNGQLRGFEFLAMILGSIIYFLALSKAVILIFSLLFSVVKKIFCIILKFLLTIFSFLYKIIIRWIMLIFSPVRKLFSKIGKIFCGIFTKFRRGTGAMIRNRRKNKKRRAVRAEKGEA